MSNYYSIRKNWSNWDATHSVEVGFATTKEEAQREADKQNAIHRMTYQLPSCFYNVVKTTKKGTPAHPNK